MPGFFLVMVKRLEPIMAFGLKHLLFMIVVIAVGLAALLNADRPPMADIIELATFVIIVVTGYASGLAPANGDLSASDSSAGVACTT